MDTHVPFWAPIRLQTYGIDRVSFFFFFSLGTTNYTVYHGYEATVSEQI